MDTTENLPLSRPTLRLDYDRDADVLYAGLGSPVDCGGEGRPDGGELDGALNDGPPCAATAIGFNGCGWPTRIDRLAESVGRHLSVEPARIASALKSAAG